MTTAPRPRPAIPVPDFYQLRREGIGHLEQAGSAHWTDYNSHDPGITILEALVYAITELGWRGGFPVEDLLASAAPGATAEDPYPGQAFPTAREILTVNPTTRKDLRRLLTDVGPVRNAWVQCRDCACGPEVAVRGLHDVLLELEADPEVGDLNDRKVTRRRTVVDPDGRRRPLVMELRFPAFSTARRDERQALVASSGALAVGVGGPFRTTTGTTPMDDDELRSHFNDVLYVDLQITVPGGDVVDIRRAALRLFANAAVRQQADVSDITSWLGDPTAEGFVHPYRSKLALADAAVADAAAALHAHRPLAEDTCHVDVVEIVDISVCADVHLDADADVELVQARLWYETERWLDPPPQFRTLDEMRAGGAATEEIFNGPALQAGFLTEEGLAATDLRSDLRISDLIDVLMEIRGVVSVENLLLTAHSPDGTPTAGLADPTWEGDVWIFGADRTAAAWRLFLPPAHRPRLHRRLSRFTFEAGGLPFAPRLDEAEDTLVELHGRAARPKLRTTDLDLPMPLGRSRDMASYHAVTNSLPATYGVGPAGLPSAAPTDRKAQALQLKAYLMVYEQVLRNAYAQLAGGVDLLSLRDGGRTYFAAPVTGITDLDQVVEATANAAAADLVEGEGTFLERRNRFLDHLLARFGESFSDHGLLMADLAGQTRARRELVGDKITFLRALPRLGHDRGRGFDRRLVPCHPDNASGLQQRVTLLLGFPNRDFLWQARSASGSPGFVHSLELREGADPVARLVPDPAVESALAALATALGLGTVRPWSLEFTNDGMLLTTRGADGADHGELLETWGEAADLMQALVTTQRETLSRLILPASYRVVAEGSGWRVRLGPAADPLGTVSGLFLTRGEAEAFAVGSATWAAHKRAIVVEHLLLRPKFPGDAGYPTWDAECGDDDPYSFLLTYALPGWTDPFNTDMALRRFADRTIIEQTPAHLVLKACWVGTDPFLAFEDAWCRWLEADAAIDWSQEHVLEAVVEILGSFSALGRDELCSCAADMVTGFGMQFAKWRDDNVAAGNVWGGFTDFTASDPEVCDGVPTEAAEVVGDFLRDRYSAWGEVSYRLHVLVNALAALRNTYPRATLHDCDDGSDANPVRLGQSVLGSN